MVVSLLIYTDKTPSHLSAIVDNNYDNDVCDLKIRSAIPLDLLSSSSLNTEVISCISRMSIENEYVCIPCS